MNVDETGPSNPSGSGASRRQQRADEILKGLNDVQRAAASHRNGPLVVFAGAGSGKTRIIAHRIAWLIESGVAPWEILAVTFTNKAAGEMKHRVEALTPHGRRCLIATFHSACARWLREFAPELGFTSDFTIYDDADSMAAIKKVLGELNVKLDDQTSANEFKAAINKVKTMAMLPSDERLQREWQELMPEAGVAVYKRYQEYLASCNAMDFADLIMNMLLLLRRNDRVRETLQRRYRYILVDEYQDTNRTQFELIARLAEGHRNLFVVGDDDQSIYSWRGAVPANIIDFDKVYPDAVKITMEQNYRCTSNIVDAANAMVSNNKYRVPKRLFTENPPGDRITYRLETDNEIEAWWVVDQLKREQERYGFAAVAIFYRTNSQSRVLEDALRRENIPYQIYGTVRFYDRMEIKDLMAYFRAVVNPSDDVSVKRIVNVPARGIGDKAVATLEAEAARRGTPLLQTIHDLVAEDAPKLASKIRPFTELITKVKTQLAAVPLAQAIEALLNEVGYLEYVEKKFPEQAVDKVENIHELGAAIADFATGHPEATLGDWLQAVTLSSSEGEEKGGVSMMTLHMAKGLEFPRVYIVGVEEGLLPHRNSLEDPDILEEERRLFYVGMTRAKEKLSLISAYRRRTYNTWSANRPSRFLTEIPAQHFEPAERAAPETDFSDVFSGAPSASYGDEVRYEYDDEASPRGRRRSRPPGGGGGGMALRVGQTVRHPTYGRGVVDELVDEFGVIKAVVQFEEFGARKVMARHLET
jgi:DNA helicase-2/ATP-dependent DNA helicase PcrA